jgi:hypothetical protein
MEQPKAMEYGSQKASPDVLKPHIYIYISSGSGMCGHGRDRTGSELEQMAGTYKCGTEASGSMKELTASALHFLWFPFWLSTLSFHGTLWDYYI